MTYLYNPVLTYMEAPHLEDEECKGKKLWRNLALSWTLNIPYAKMTFHLHTDSSELNISPDERLKTSENCRGVNHSKLFYIHNNHSSHSWAAEQFLRPFNLHRDWEILPPYSSGSVQPATSECSAHAPKQQALLQKDDRQLSSQTDRCLQPSCIKFMAHLHFSTLTHDVKFWVVFRIPWFSLWEVTALSKLYVGKKPQITLYIGLEALIKVLPVGTWICVFM